jgi:hypothetical protein
VSIAAKINLNFSFPVVRTSFHYGHQAPLEGLNFSRARNLYAIVVALNAEQDPLR